MNYTKTEKTVKRHTLQKAIDNARIILKGKPVCMDSVRRYPENILFTTEELNNVVDQIVTDSLYY